MAAVWKATAGAWTIDDRIVHLADPLPPTRDLAGMTLSAYSWRVIVGTMRDPADMAWLIGETIRGTYLTERRLDRIADALVENLFGQPRWVVQRLWREAIGRWRELDAELGARGVDLLALPPDRATNIVFGQLRRAHSGKEEHLRTWLAQLEEQPARVLATPAAVESAAADWFAAAGMLAGRNGLAPRLPAPPGVDSELSIT